VGKIEMGSKKPIRNGWDGEGWNCRGRMEWQKGSGNKMAKLRIVKDEMTKNGMAKNVMDMANHAVALSGI
jgi:hypothetical protein